MWWQCRVCYVVAYVYKQVMPQNFRHPTASHAHRHPYLVSLLFLAFLYSTNFILVFFEFHDFQREDDSEQTPIWQWQWTNSHIMVQSNIPILCTKLYYHILWLRVTESISYSLQLFLSALLLSALKSNKIPYSPALIKKIIENTATPLGKHDPFSVGHGVIQVCHNVKYYMYIWATELCLYYFDLLYVLLLTCNTWHEYTYQCWTTAVLPFIFVWHLHVLTGKHAHFCVKIWY